jgi:hypothetical protein
MAGPVSVGGSVSVIEVDKLLQSLGKQVSNLRPFFTAVDAQVSTLLREQFETRGVRLNGTPWAPISEATQELRIVRRILSTRARNRARANAGKDTPLYDTGGLYSAFTKPGAPGSVRTMSNLEYTRGVNYAPDGVPVAVLMQEGFMSPYKPVINKRGEAVFIRRKGGPKKVPARPIIPKELPVPIVKAWEGMLVGYIEQGVL